MAGGLPGEAPAEPSAAVVAVSPTPAAVLIVESPSRPGAVITTRDLIVRGSIRGTSVPVLVTFESRGAMLVSRVQPSPAPLLAPAGFEVVFHLPDPRPTGPLVVQVMAMSPAGVTLEVIRLPVTIGDLAPSTPREVGRDGDGGLGEDGIIGGIVFGNAWDPEALGSRP